ncbi:MAG: hypothetical protein ACI89X_002628 [Planctomycetota bacterium]|jgi:hypothetical protein
MRIRPPSFGFAYLVLAVVAFAGYFAYIQKADWWQLPEGRPRDLAESRYLLSLVDSATPAQRVTWLGDAMRLASKHAEWSLAESILMASLAHKAKLKPNALIEVVDGRCWVAGSESASAKVGAAPVAFLSHNTADTWTLRTEWSANRDGALETREMGQEWQSQTIKAGVNTAVEWGVPANGFSYLEVRATASMFAPKDAAQDGDQPGIELKGVEAKQ